jgi:hypothetical protein
MEESVEEQAAAAGGASVEPEGELVEVTVELVHRVPVFVVGGLLDGPGAAGRRPVARPGATVFTPVNLAADSRQPSVSRL